MAGCGDLGARAARQIHARGGEVWGLRRRPALLGAPLFGIGGDLGCPQSLRGADSLAALPALDAVVATPVAAEFSERGYRSGYVQGVRNLLQALAERDEAPLVLLVSSTAVYGPDSGAGKEGWIDEGSKARPDGWRGELLLQAEAELRAWPHRSCVLRVAGLYPGTSHRAIEAAVRTEPSAEHERVVNRFHRTDCAALIGLLLQRHLRGQDIPDLVLGCDGTGLTQAEQMRWIRQQVRDALGGQLPQLPTARAAQNPKYPPAARRRIGSRLYGELGFQLLHPDFRSGLRPALRQWLDGLPDQAAGRR